MKNMARPAASIDRPGMRHLSGETFRMGSDRFYPEEGSSRLVKVDPFRIDETPVTNGEFAAFVDATGYVTIAEIAPDPADYPGMDPALAHPGSLVFQRTAMPVPLDDPSQWWAFVFGADWRHPTGIDSGIDDILDHPVVQIAYDDAAAYAAWAGKALPTEAEWEFAARGGLEDADYAWGDELAPDGQIMANYWQGLFPVSNLRADGGYRTTPVGSYPANGYGLVRIGRRVLKGGSHLCAANYCQRYRPAARHAQMIDSATSHIGFRCVVRGD